MASIYSAALESIESFKTSLADASAFTTLYINTYKEYAYRNIKDSELLKEKIVEKLATALNDAEKTQEINGGES